MNWTPKTALGRLVSEGKITKFDQITERGMKIMEPEIVDFFFPELQTDFVLVGQAKGKFGGGQRRVYKHTQKKIREGARMKFSYVAVVGNGDGYVGVGKGSSRESLPAKERAIKSAKLNITRIIRACGSWECGCGKPHSVPFRVIGKAGSVRMKLFPAPRGSGLVTHSEARRILKIAGVSDAWSQSDGDTRSRINLAFATFNALKETIATTIPKDFAEKWGAK